MSRFFNQTRRADQHVNVTPVSDAPVTESLNVQEILGTIPDDESDTAIAAPGNGGHLFPVESSLADLGAEITAAPAVVEVKPERYRTFSLPRTLERLFVSESPDSDHLAVESYRTLRTRLLREQAKRGFRSMIISSCSPEEGKTLTAANLAVSFGQLTKFPVLLVDGDLRTRGLSRLLGDPSGPGLAELLAGQVTREATVLQSDFPDLHFVSAGSLTTPAPQLLTGAAWKEFLAWAKQNFKLVIVDSPPVLPLADFDLIAASCEGVLIVVRSRVTQREGLEKVVAHVDKSKLLGVVLNSVADGIHDSYHYPYRYGGKAGKSTAKTNWMASPQAEVTASSSGA